MNKFEYQINRNNWRNERMICRGINEERIDEDYDALQYGGVFDDFDTYDSDSFEEE